jgi:hypothetical protein
MVCALILFAINARDGLRLYEISDELDQFVTAKMIDLGWRLYRDIFQIHGPVPFMLAHLYTLIVSHTNFLYIRLVPVFLALASCLSLAFSPALKTAKARIWAGAIYLSIMAFVWYLDGFNTLTYYSIGGVLFVIVISQCAAPAIFGEAPTAFGLFSAGAAGALACFCAYSNGPAFVVLTLALFIPTLFLQSRGVAAVLAAPLWLGMLLVALSVMLWVYRFGDVRGYFVYHLYFNQAIFSHYIDYSPWEFLTNFVFIISPAESVHVVTLGLFLCWIMLAICLQNWRAGGRVPFVNRVALALGIFGVVLTNPRAFESMRDCGFVGANVAMASIMSAAVLERQLMLRSPSGVLCSMSIPVLAIIVIYEALTFSYLCYGVPRREMSNYMTSMRPSDESIYRWVRSMTREQGDFLVLSYNATVYFAANRLPASGNLYYSPMQAEYMRKPKWGYKIDLCADIRTRLPAVIWLFNWRMWNRWSLDEYEPCVLELVVEHYKQLSFGSPWLVRDDLFERAQLLLPSGADTSLNLGPGEPKIEVVQRSPELSPATSIAIRLAPGYETLKAPLRRIGVLLAANGRENPGDAELRLTTPEGTRFSYPFRLAALPENGYKYFDVAPHWYAAAEIASTSGGGISVWESNLDMTYTCIIYEYLDGSRRYAPACPVM